MNHYRQSIIVFGFVLPALGALATVGGFAYLRGRIKASFDNKSASRLLLLLYQ